MLTSLAGIEHPGRLADTVAAHLALKLSEKQRVLESHEVRARLEQVIGLVEGEIEVLQIEKGSAAASSRRWRRASASTTSTSR